MTTKNIFTYLLLITTALASFACSDVKTPETQTEKQSDSTDITEVESTGADGFDLISFFEVGEALKGSPEFSLIYEGAKWYFSSIENREKFKKNAVKYLPQLGESCPYSLAEGKEIKGKPTYHKVIDGKLYFFYNKEYADKFEKDSKLLLEKARANWEKMNKKEK